MYDNDSRQHFEVEQVHHLREEAKLYNLDFTRARISIQGDKHTVTFDKPVVPIDKFLGYAPPARFSHPSALQVEGTMLDGLIRIQRAERQAVRCGVVFGWSGEQINRRPLTAEELAEYKSRTTHAVQVAKLQADLQEAIQAQARRAQKVRESVDLSARYSVIDEADVLTPAETTADLVGHTLINAPSKPRRAKSARSL